MIRRWTQDGKPIPFPEGQIESANPSGAPNAGSARHLARSPEPSPRPREIRCLYCGHTEPDDLSAAYSWLEDRWVWMCRIWLWCNFRETAQMNARRAHPSGTDL